MNTENCVYWLDTNPHTVAPVPLFDTKVTVCCDILCTACPYFYEETTPTGFITYSVTTSSYISMLQNYVISELLQRNALNDIIWMEDGALSHVAKSV